MANTTIPAMLFVGQMKLVATNTPPMPPTKNRYRTADGLKLFMMRFSFHGDPALVDFLSLEFRQVLALDELPSEAMIYITMIGLMSRRLARTNRV